MDFIKEKLYQVYKWAEKKIRHWIETEGEVCTTYMLGVAGGYLAKKSDEWAFENNWFKRAVDRYFATEPLRLAYDPNVKPEGQVYRVPTSIVISYNMLKPLKALRFKRKMLLD